MLLLQCELGKQPYTPVNTLLVNWYKLFHSSSWHTNFPSLFPLTLKDCIMIRHYTILENWLYTLEFSIGAQIIFNLLPKNYTMSYINH